MHFELIYLQLGLLILVLNIIPFFMPPTWIILAFFYTHFHLDFFPTIIIGAVSASLGRVGLANLARNYFEPFLPKFVNKNYQYLGKFFEKNQNLTIPMVLTYAFFPIPSNQIFIILGLSNININLVAFSFFIGRLISYTFWVTLAYQATSQLESIFINHYSNTYNILIELFGLGFIMLIGLVNWKQVLKLK